MEAKNEDWPPKWGVTMYHSQRALIVDKAKDLRKIKTEVEACSATLKKSKTLLKFGIISLNFRNKIIGAGSRLFSQLIVPSLDFPAAFGRIVQCNNG
jgi:hypothetical protein